MRRSLPWPELAVLAITAAWGLSFVVIKTGLQDAGTFSLTALRMTVGLASALVVLHPRLGAATSLEWRAGVLGGLLLAGGYLLQTAGLRTADAGAGGFITAFYVALVPFVDATVHRRLPHLRDLGILLVCCAGICLIALDPATFRLSQGEVLIALSALCWAAQIVVVGRVADRVRAGTLTTIQLLVLAAVAWGGVLVADEPPIRWSSRLLAAVFFLGHVTCSLAFFVQAWAQQRFSPTRVAILFSPEPVIAAAFGVWLLGEPMDARHVAGGLLVLGAVAASVLLDRRAAA